MCVFQQCNWHLVLLRQVDVNSVIRKWQHLVRLQSREVDCAVDSEVARHTPGMLQEPERASEGLGGTYFFKDEAGSKVAIVKPCDEEPLGTKQPQGSHHHCLATVVLHQGGGFANLTIVI